MSFIQNVRKKLLKWLPFSLHTHCVRNAAIQSFDITGCARNHDAHDSWGHEWMFSRGPVAEQGQKFSPQVGVVDWWAQPKVF